MIRRNFGGRRVEQQALRQAALFGWNGREALQLLGVDDGQVEAGLGRVIKENRIDHFARRRRQAEGDVRDAQNGLDERDFFLDQPDGFDGLDRAADVVFIAGRAGENQRIDDDVFGGDAVFFRQQLNRSLGHRQFPLARERLRLQLVLVDGSADNRRAVGFGERADQRSNFSSPSSRLMELMIDLPWQ